LKDISDHKFLTARFLQSVQKWPKNKALYINDRYYSYTELMKIADHIYEMIPQDKVYKRIGIYCNDDINTYASILAISLYGAGYVPLNNRFPVSKNRSVVEKSDLSLILSSVENEELIAIKGNAKILNTSFVLSDLNDLSSTIKKYKKVEQPYAYILFTSGSTGEPKGVAVSDENLKTLFEYFYGNYGFTEGDRFLQASELTFDFSVLSFFMPLHFGACSFVVPDSGIKFVKIIQMLKEFEITVFSIVPSILRYLEKYLEEIQLPKLRLSFFSGDALYLDLASKWSRVVPNGKIFNCYGTTESAVVCTSYLFDKNTSAIDSVNGIVPLGKPFSTMQILILDENGMPAEKGELCLSGNQVISSYLNGADDSRFFIREGRKYYKPGDIVSFNEKGDLIFLGRKDTQVKINGFRVELVEIEFAIEKILNAKCVVLCIRDDKQLNTLIAFIEQKYINEELLRMQLADSLPEYMIPQKFIAIDKFDLSINGNDIKFYSCRINVDRHYPC